MYKQKKSYFTKRKSNCRGQDKFRKMYESKGALPTSKRSVVD